MRNEIWSMISHLGAPSWFITLSPADNRHPICLYFADSDIEFKPEIRCSNERNLLIAKNPVAAARFFNLMIHMFIKHVLGVQTDHPGLYGETSAYYGTVEQQGRLTLHLHTILWIRGSLSPQNIREQIMNDDSDFQRKLIEYLEGCHIGEFLTGTLEDIQNKIPHISEKALGIHTIHINAENTKYDTNKYQDPTLTLPAAPPQACMNQCNQCTKCENLTNWWKNYNETVDDIILWSNVHKCSVSSSQEKPSNNIMNNNQNYKGPKGCINKEGVCKARFPRDIFPETIVDTTDGHIFMKKKEAMINTLSPPVTYLLRSITDVSSMLSGTTLKAVISYISDYIVKPTLKTHQIFSSAYDVFDKNNDIVISDADIKPKDAARKLIMKMVNALSSKMEIGSPMACLYLLGNPDHYTSHEFIPFWWRTYVSHIQRNCTDNISNKTNVQAEEDINLDDTMNVDKKEYKQLIDNDRSMDDTILSHDAEQFDLLTEEKVILTQNEGQYVAISNIDDYRYRPQIFTNISLYDWIRFNNKKKRKEKEKLHNNDIELPSLNKTKSKTQHSYYQFLPAHPQYNTHLVRCNITENNKIPNFIGGSLPRSDQGDREFYCCTMLTTFKPWRSALDLKNTNESWDDADIRTAY